jgi:hypothetical protein
MKSPFLLFALFISLSASAAPFTSSDLSGHRWCKILDEGKKMEMLDLQADGELKLTKMELTRSKLTSQVNAEIQGFSAGTWSLNGDFFTTKIQGETETLKVSLVSEDRLEFSNGDLADKCD